MTKKLARIRDDRPIHTWFDLSYANYFVMPRAMLQSMPAAWQKKFVALLSELETARERSGLKVNLAYRVQAVDPKGRYTPDDVPHYRHAPNLFTILESTRRGTEH